MNGSLARAPVSVSVHVPTGSSDTRVGCSLDLCLRLITVCVCLRRQIRYRPGCDSSSSRSSCGSSPCIRPEPCREKGLRQLPASEDTL